MIESRKWNEVPKIIEEQTKPNCNQSPKEIYPCFTVSGGEFALS